MISRRSGGLSIGINLNPDTACNFGCIYCQVDRSVEPRIRRVEPEVLREELQSMIELAISKKLFDDEAFNGVPDDMRAIKDFAFSGDGEPTTCKQFLECVYICSDLKRKTGLESAKVVLITDACYLTKPEVKEGLEVMDSCNGEIWAKLDAGTEDYYQLINRPNYPLWHVIENIADAAKVRPIVIQSMFLRYESDPPSEAELQAYVGRLEEILAAGGKMDHVQVYTVARVPAQETVTALSDDEIDRIADMIRNETNLKAETYYAPRS